MKYLFSWWFEALTKPALERSAADEIWLWALPCIIIFIIMIIIIIVDACVAHKK